MSREQYNEVMRQNQEITNKLQEAYIIKDTLQQRIDYFVSNEEELQMLLSSI